MGFLPFLHVPLRDFIRTLSQRGHEVSLVKSYQRNRNVPEEERPECRNVMIGLLLRRLPKSKFLEPLVFLEFVIKTIVHAVLERPRVVVAVDVDTLLQGYVAARISRAKLIYYSLELYTERPGYGAKRFWVWFERLLINKAALVVTCEPNRAKVMVEKYGAHTLPMCVLNVPLYAPLERTNALQEYLAGKGIRAKKIALYQGGIGRSRCADQIIEAARSLDEGNVIVFVGSLPADYDLDGKVRAHGVEDKVFYYGFAESMEKLADLTCSADLGLQLQLNAGLNSYYCAPCKLFQYFMAGLPVLASNFPGMLAIVEGENAGLCADPESPEAIAAAINKILGDDALRETMSANARRVAKEKYRFEIEGKKLIDAVEDMLAR